MKALLIDDEIQAIEALQSLLNKYCQEIDVIGHSQTIQNGITKINQLKPDVIFLDIEMLDGNGLDLLSKFEDPFFKTIIVSGHDHYAIQALRNQAVDYLLKPIDSDELIIAVNRLKEAIPIHNKAIKKSDANQTKFTEQIGIPGLEGVDFISSTDILYAASAGSNTILHLTKNRHLVASKHIAAIEEVLTPLQFFRVHRQYLVNLSKVKKYHRGLAGSIRLTDDSLVPVSRRKKKEFLNMLNLI